MADGTLQVQRAAEQDNVGHHSFTQDCESQSYKDKLLFVTWGEIEFISCYIFLTDEFFFIVLYSAIYRNLFNKNAKRRV